MRKLKVLKLLDEAEQALKALLVTDDDGDD